MNATLYSDNWEAEQIADAKQLIGPVLILGASGFIGAKLFFNLSRYRKDVFGCARDFKSNWRFQDDSWSNLLICDIAKHSQLKQVLDKVKPKTIFNLSAYGGHASQTDIQQIHSINYFGALNVLMLLKRIGCQALVQAGSSSEYGLNSAGPVETEQLLPNSDYAVSKIGVSYLIKYYGKVTGLPVMHLRLYSIYGPWEGRERLMPVLVRNCIEKKLPNFVDRDVSHDFVYIDDCLSAVIKGALHLYTKKNFGETFNIATGVKTNMETLSKTARKVFGVIAKPNFGSMPNRAWDVKDWYGNPKLANTILGWRYKTKLAEGLLLLAEWERHFMKTKLEIKKAR